MWQGNMNRKKIVKSILCSLLLMLSCGSSGVNAASGILQVVTRQGFWANDFSDDFLLLQHYYYLEGDNNTATGTFDFEQHLGLSRLIKPWHFGENNQYQYIFEGIVPLTSKTRASSNGRLSGLSDPFTYTSLGWNNPEKTDHVQLFSINRYPFGNENLSTDAYAIMPGVGYQHRWSEWLFDASFGYWKEFDTEGTKDTKGKDYYNLNGVVSYHPDSKLSFYTQADYKDTNESEVGDVGQDNEGHNLGLAIGVGYAFSSSFQVDVKVYRDIDSRNEAIDESTAINLRFFIEF